MDPYPRWRRTMTALAASITLVAGCGGSAVTGGTPTTPSAAGGYRLDRMKQDGTAWFSASAGLAVSPDFGASIAPLAALPVPAAEVSDVTESGRQILLTQVTVNGPRVFSSPDRGRSWTEQALPRSPVPSADAVFADDLGSVAVVSKDATSSNFSSGHLYVRTGSGAWAMTELPAFGRLHRSKRWLWLAGGTTPALYRSADGGRTWSTVRLPTECAPAGAAVAVPGADGRGRLVVVSTIGDSTGNAEVRVCASSDEGRSWQPGVRVGLRAQVEQGVTVPSTVTRAGVWVVDPQSRTVLVIGDDASVHRRVPLGLPAGVTAVVASSAMTAWASVSPTTCPTGKTSCRTTAEIFTTGDGGATWTRAG